MRIVGVYILSVIGCAAVGADDAFEDAKWDDASRDFSASVGYGYKENVLYSEVVPQDSAFAYANLEGMAKGDMLGLGARWVVMALADLRSYESINGIPDETFGVAVGEFVKSAGLFSEATLGMQYLYVDQVFDATFDILEERRILLRAQQPELYLEWRSLFWEFEWAAQGSVSRMYFSDRTNDYETVGLEFELNYDLTDKSRIILTLEGQERTYTDRKANDAEGYSVAGSLRSTETVALELEWERDFSWRDWAGSLGLEAKISVREDPFEGYYNRDRSRLGFEWEMETGGWYAAADFGFTQSEYTRQVTESDEVRTSDAWLGSLIVEKDLNERWAAFLQLDIEEEESNEFLYSYETSSFLFGFKLK